MFEEIKLAIALIGGMICGLYDLKTSDMLDWLALLMIGLGIGIHAIESYIVGNLYPLIACLVVTACYFLFSLFMYYKGYWGGGDGELLIAFGSLLPLGLNNSQLFSIKYFLSVFIVGGFYSFLYASLL
jgi:Flp pilus assembly protein protease CpaA